MRRRAFVHLALLAAVIAAATTAIAVVIPWLPVSASKERDRIDLTYWLATGIAIFIFSIVAAAILYSVWRFRAHPRRRLRRAADPRPHRARDRLDGDPDRARHRDRDRQRDRAPRQRHDAEERAPRQRDRRSSSRGPSRTRTGRRRASSHPTCTCRSTARRSSRSTSVDVLHSFWVPEFGQKQDAVPGRTNPLKITPTKLGTYPVICTELCGLGHALMRRSAIVLTRGRLRGEEVGGTALRRRPAPQARPAVRRPVGRERRRRQGRLHGERLRQLPHADGGAARPARSGPTSISSRPRRSGPDSRSSRSSASRSSNPNAYIEPGLPERA